MLSTPTLAQGLRKAVWLVAIAACSVSPWATAATPPTRLAWLKEGQLEGRDRQATSTQPEAWRTPLGSTWKLFVFSYLHAQSAREPAYRCSSTSRQPDEEYCCQPGESIQRDQALERSCGPYFSPSRLNITEAAWTRHWQARGAPAWLTSLTAMHADQEVPVADLLAALQSLAEPQRAAARRALLPLNTRDELVLQWLGSGPRFKTWSWQVGGQRAGGAAGWLADGSAFWFGAPGTSKTALRHHAAWIANQWNTTPHSPIDPAASSEQPCVIVDYFQRYPLRSVQTSARTPAPAGPLKGRHQIHFVNGQSLSIQAEPSLELRATPEGLRIIGRMTLEEYVARVIDREGQAQETQAARALAVAARTYVLQNSTADQGCRRIADDSRTQRVSPNRPTSAARSAALFTQGLVIRGIPVRYHLHQSAPRTMAWHTAVEQSRDGWSFDAILRHAYAPLQWDHAQASDDCTDLPQAHQWLMQRQARWRPILQRQVGYEEPGAAVRICQLSVGIPHSDQRRLWIRLREWHSREGRVTLIHEYLHLAFRNHPRGRDEAFIEQLAQQLADL